jgi:hypothetical protein
MMQLLTEGEPGATATVNRWEYIDRSARLEAIAFSLTSCTAHSLNNRAWKEVTHQHLILSFFLLTLGTETHQYANPIFYLAAQSLLPPGLRLSTAGA